MAAKMKLHNRHLFCGQFTLLAAIRLKQYGLGGLLEPCVANDFKRFSSQRGTLSEVYLAMRARTLPKLRPCKTWRMRSN